VGSDTAASTRAPSTNQLALVNDWRRTLTHLTGPGIATLQTMFHRALHTVAKTHIVLSLADPGESRDVAFLQRRLIIEVQWRVHSNKNATRLLIVIIQ